MCMIVCILWKADFECCTYFNSYYSLYRVMSGQVFTATELPTSATVDVDSETLSELHYVK